MRASFLFLLNLALYARGDSNPQPLAPEANDVLFTSLVFIVFKVVFIFLGCDLGAKVSLKLA